MKRDWFKNAMRIALLALWLGAAGVGSAHFLHYAGTPSQGAASMTDLLAARNPLSLNSSSATAQKFSLVVYLHPGCACSTATLAELRRLLGRAANPSLSVRLVFVTGPGFPEVATSKLKADAAAVLGASIEIDTDGKAARLAGAGASGVAFLYDAQGKVLFRGGLTAARGHEGHSAGQEMVLNILAHGPGVVPVSTPVFGCSLFAAARNPISGQIGPSAGVNHAHR